MSGWFVFSLSLTLFVIYIHFREKQNATTEQTEVLLKKNFDESEDNTTNNDENKSRKNTPLLQILTAVFR